MHENTVIIAGTCTVYIAELHTYIYNQFCTCTRIFHSIKLIALCVQIVHMYMCTFPCGDIVLVAMTSSGFSKAI